MTTNKMDTIIMLSLYKVGGDRQVLSILFITVEHSTVPNKKEKKIKFKIEEKIGNFSIDSFKFSQLSTQCIQ